MELDVELARTGHGFWLVPVTKSQEPTSPQLSAPTWNPDPALQLGKPRPIAWNIDRLKALWNGLKLWVARFGGLTVDCCFEDDDNRKQGDHIRLRCESSAALLLRDCLNQFHVDNRPILRKTVLLWCSADGRAIMAA
jgi:hypothetical protein